MLSAFQKIERKIYAHSNSPITELQRSKHRFFLWCKSYKDRFLFKFFLSTVILGMHYLIVINGRTNICTEWLQKSDTSKKVELFHLYLGLPKGQINKDFTHPSKDKNFMTGSISKTPRRKCFYSTFNHHLQAYLELRAAKNVKFI